MRRFLTVSLLALVVLLVAGCGSRTREGGPLSLASTGGESAVSAPGDGAAGADWSDAGSPDTGPVASGPASSSGADDDQVAPARDGTDADGAGTRGEEPAADDDPFGDEDGHPREASGIVASVEPRCVERPGAVTVTIRTAPLADVAYGASFSDGGHHGQWGLGMADATGTLIWTVSVGADVPDGNAVVAATALNSETGEGGSGEGGFRVASRGAC